MLQEMGLRELGTWAAMYELDPWGEERSDLRSGIVASVIANVNRGRGSRTYVPGDFMPFREQQPKSKLAADLKAFLKSMPSKKKAK